MNKRVFLLRFALIGFVGLGINACSEKEDFSNLQNNTVEPINIGLVYRESSLRNQEIAFAVYDDQSNEIVDNITFYVDGSPINGRVFSSDVEGTFSVYAEYEDQGVLSTTDTGNFTVVIPTKNVLVEDYTGTWCGYCPAVSAAVDAVQGLTESISIVALHNGDDLSLAIEPQIREGLGIPSGSPRARIDRTIVWGLGTPPEFPTEDVLSLAGIESALAIGLESSVSDRSLSVMVSVASEQAMSDLKLVVYLTEDGLLRDQTNYYDNDETSPYFGQGNPMIDFEQKHVLRAALTDAIGDPIPATNALTDYTAQLNYNIPTDFDIDQLELVVMVVDQNNLAINTQHASIGEKVSYR